MLDSEGPAPSKGERTRRRIIEAAVRLVARRGFGETSFQMIADELGLTQSAVLYHFKSKNGLIEAVLHAIIADNHELVQGLMELDDNAAERLLKHCCGNVLWAVRYRQDAQILLLLYYLGGFEPRFAQLLARRVSTGRERLLSHLLAGQREGLLRLTAGPEDVAERLQDSLIGAMFYAASAPKGSVREEGLERKWRDVLCALTGCDPARIRPGRLRLTARAPAGLRARGR